MRCIGDDDREGYFENIAKFSLVMIIKRKILFIMHESIIICLTRVTGRKRVLQMMTRAFRVFGRIKPLAGE